MSNPDVPDAWDETIRGLPYAHILQTEQWGEFKRRRKGWTPDKSLLRDAHNRVVGAALALTRRIGPLAVIYVPKGPMLNYNDAPLLGQMLDQLESLARRQHAIWLKIDPDVIAAVGVPGELGASEQPDGQQVMTMLKQRA